MKVRLLIVRLTLEALVAFSLHGGINLEDYSTVEPDVVRSQRKSDHSELEVKQRLDRLANSAKETISSLPDQSPRTRALAICKVMKDDGIIAARDIDYYATENSFIHFSLQRRGGLPITLAIIFTAIAGRCELPAAPINYVRKLWGFC